MKRKGFILLLVIVFALTPILSDGQAFTQETEDTDPIIKSNLDKWAVIPKIEQRPDIVGNLNDPVWEDVRALSDFVTVYDNELAKTDTEVKAAYDEENVYIGAAS